MVHLVAYDLHKPYAASRDYTEIEDAIKSYGYYLHLQESVWLIKTNQTTTQVYDFLWKSMQSGDKLFVSQQSGSATWNGHSSVADDWIKGVFK